MRAAAVLLALLAQPLSAQAAFEVSGYVAARGVSATGAEPLDARSLTLEARYRF